MFHVGKFVQQYDTFEVIFYREVQNVFYGIFQNLGETRLHGSILCEKDFIEKSAKKPQKTTTIHIILTLTLTLTLTLNKIYFDINEKDKQQEIDNMISRYQ